jgi:hypothetical protein
MEKEEASVRITGNVCLARSPNLASITYGTVIPLSPVAYRRRTFQIWAEDLSGSAVPKTVRMHENKAVIATFTGLHE